MKKRYLPRLADKKIEEYLRTFGGVLVEGCKWCGKSTTAARLSKTVIELQDPAQRTNYLSIAKTRPDLLLQGEKPLLIDEWQDAPTIWDAVRHEVDHSNEKGLYLLTGSNTPKTDETPSHTGTGRIGRFRMRPMSLLESKDSRGTVSLEALLSGEKTATGKSKHSIEDIAFLCMRGGWPDLVSNKQANIPLAMRQYLESITRDSAYANASEKRTEKNRLLLKSLARNIASPVSLRTIADDTSMDDKTVAAYLDHYQQLFIIDDIPAWTPKLRSKTTVRASAKRNLVDPSLALAALNATDLDLIHDFNTLGLVFESLCLRDLKIYAQELNGEVSYYRDRRGRECDAIVHSQDGAWGAIEIKIGDPESIDLAAKNLLELRNVVDLDVEKQPKFLMVLTATGYAYTREDGVIVCPIGCLGI